MKAKIVADTKEAMRSKDKLKVSTLRLLLSEIKYAEIDKGGELDADEMIKAVLRELKKRREAIPQYRRGGREDLAAKEEAEAEILKAYLPEPMSEADLEALIEEAVRATGAAGPQEIGKVMGFLMPKVKGRADGAHVSAKVREKLGGMV